MALMVVAMFFIQDVDFHDAEQREEFSAAMLDQNRYLFSDNESIDPEVRHMILLVLGLNFW